MSKKFIITSLIILIILVILILVFFFRENLIYFINAEWLKILYAAILAIVIGIIIEFVYKKYSAKSKLLQTTVSPPVQQNQSMAKLILKENQEFIIKEFERNFGREDFIGVIVGDDLLFIGKDHFKITKDTDGYYIEDLNTKNGTLLNDVEIKGRQKEKLENGDIITIAKTLKIEYQEF